MIRVWKVFQDGALPESTMVSHDFFRLFSWKNAMISYYMTTYFRLQHETIIMEYTGLTKVVTTTIINVS